MTIGQVSLLLALLAFLAAAISLAALGASLFGDASSTSEYKQLLLPLAFVIALVSTFASLYYSGIAHFSPCRLCWWQRIFMYPLVPLLGIGAWRRDNSAFLYALPLALGGLGYSAYHTQLRWFLEQGSSCEAEAACTSVWVNTFGFASIPFMAFCGFLAVFGLAITALRLDRSAQTPAPRSPKTTKGNSHDNTRPYETLIDIRLTSCARRAPARGIGYRRRCRGSHPWRFQR